METIRNYAEEQVIFSYDILGVTRADMYEMTQVYDEVNKVVINHLTEDKKVYISDDTLVRVLAILDVLTENNRTTLKKSVFEERRETILKSHEQVKKMAEESDLRTKEELKLAAFKERLIGRRCLTLSSLTHTP